MACGRRGGRLPKQLRKCVSVEQRLWDNRVIVGATYFHNDLSNVIGFNGQFQTFNLGAADYKVPQFVALQTEPLPRNAAGKVLKDVLREHTVWGAPVR